MTDTIPGKKTDRRPRRRATAPDNSKLRRAGKSQGLRRPIAGRAGGICLYFALLSL